MANTPDEYIIDIHGITKIFDRKVVVNKVNLQIQKGKIYGFLGSNGSGKTTTLRMVCGLLTPDAGSGTCLGYDIIKESDKIRRNVGYMTQKFSFWDDLTIEQNLDFVARIFQIPHRKEKVQKTLSILGLADRAQQRTWKLSGGWKQRLALAASLIHDPKILLLDEPTAGVDPQSRREFWEELKRLAADGMTILVSTHYMDEAERCDRLIFINLGNLLAQGTPKEILSQLPKFIKNPNLEDAFVYFLKKGAEQKSSPKVEPKRKGGHR